MCRNFCFFRLFSHFSSASLLSLSLSLYNSFVSRALALTYTLSLRRSNFYELACRFNCFILVFLFSVSVFQCSRCCLFPFRSLVLSYCRCSRLECVRQRFIYSSICSWCTLFTIEHTQYSHTNIEHVAHYYYYCFSAINEVCIDIGSVDAIIQYCSARWMYILFHFFHGDFGDASPKIPFN